MRYLSVGGLVAMGFDPSGDYLLTISHSGRGVFSTHTWERVSRDRALAYPIDGHGIGIGPIAGVSVAVREIEWDTENLTLTSADGSVSLVYDGGTITMTVNGT